MLQQLLLLVIILLLTTTMMMTMIIIIMRRMRKRKKTLTMTVTKKDMVWQNKHDALGWHSHSWSRNILRRIITSRTKTDLMFLRKYVINILFLVLGFGVKLGTD